MPHKLRLGCQHKVFFPRVCLRTFYLQLNIKWGKLGQTSLKQPRPLLKLLFVTFRIKIGIFKPLSLYFKRKIRNISLPINLVGTYMKDIGPFLSQLPNIGDV